MEEFDKFVNTYLNPSSPGAGISAVFLTFFTGKLAPKMPSRFYEVLDNSIVKVLIVAFLLNQQIRMPTYAVVASIIMVFGIELLIKIFAPETPPLSELVKTVTGKTEEDEKKKKEENGESGCNCYCGHTIYANEPKPKKNQGQQG